MRFLITDTTLDPDKLRLGFVEENSGALVTFEGWVRNVNERKKVLRLEYEAYQTLATLEGNRIIEEALSRFEVQRATCVHRTGTLVIGELAVWIGVSASHREAAFEACRYIIDEIKKRVPIWKKEYYEGEEPAWLDPTRGDDHETPAGSSH